MARYSDSPSPISGTTSLFVRGYTGLKRVGNSIDSGREMADDRLLTSYLQREHFVCLGKVWHMNFKMNW